MLPRYRVDLSGESNEIQAMIDSLQAQAHAAVQVITRGQDKAKSTVSKASNAGDALKAITESVTTINNMNTEIALSSEQQTIVTEEINNNVVNISLVADENASASDKLGQSSQNLACLAEELNNLVSQFKY